MHTESQEVGPAVLNGIVEGFPDRHQNLMRSGSSNVQSIQVVLERDRVATLSRHLRYHATKRLDQVNLFLALLTHVPYSFAGFVDGRSDLHAGILQKLPIRRSILCRRARDRLQQGRGSSASLDDGVV